MLTHFVDIYHLFTSTEKMREMFQFHNFSSLFLNSSAHNILNDVLKIHGLVGSLLFSGFSVFDGFLESVILSSVISPTGGMVMCFSSSQASILHLQKDMLILFFFGCFFDKILSCFCHIFD